MALDSVAIILMAKCPAAGTVKTGLVGLLSAGEAAAVHGLFLRHLVLRLDRLSPAELIVCFDPPESDHAMRSLIGEIAVTFIPQSGSGIAERIGAAFSEIAKRHARVLILGVATPDVPLDQLFAAAELAEKVPVFVGPTTAGRCWCLGLWNKVEASAMLDNVAWSSDKEARQIMEHAAALGYACGKLEPWESVETPAEMERLLVRLKKSGAAADRQLLAELQRVAPGLDTGLHPGSKERGSV